MKLAFLVYDSRSGSTLLARELVAGLDSVWVTPEVGFDYLLRIGDAGLRRHGWAAALRRLYQGHEFLNFPLAFDDALECVGGPGSNFSPVQGIMALLSAFAIHELGCEPEWVVVKNGSHLRYWRELQDFFGEELVLINVVRDPRAVINSKLRTRRPYRPWEVMAWAGAVPAALRWNDYTDRVLAAERAGVRVSQVRYESLVGDPGGVIADCARFLQARPGRGRAYAVPEREQAIHSLVLAGGVSGGRVEAWETELGKRARREIEILCGEHMHRLGYPGGIRGRPDLRLWALLRSLPEVLPKLFKHWFKRGGRSSSTVQVETRDG